MQWPSLWEQSLSLILPVQFVVWKWVYAYDITTSHLGYNHKRSFGSPEIMIKYCFNIIPTTSSYGYKGTRLLGNKPIEY
jgi:hypothetical protein